MEHIRAKKSLGQNFLRSEAVLREIIEAAELNADDIVLEIGPGKGVLTRALLEKARKVVAIEKDDRLIEDLRREFSGELSNSKLELVHGDALETDPPSGQYKIVANIPYYITGQFLRTFLTGETQPTRMVLLLQKEVAQRIVARDGKESILSLSVKAYGEPHYMNTVEARHFSPAPKVDSAILLIKNISKKFFSENGLSEEEFFATIKKAFLHKRKMVAQNLEIAKVDRAHIFAELGLDERSRAEDIKLEDWPKLIKRLSRP